MRSESLSARGGSLIATVPTLETVPAPRDEAGPRWVRPFVSAGTRKTFGLFEAASTQE